MKTALVKVWIEGDEFDASIQYTKTYKGDGVTAHNRFLKNAQRKFPDWKRIETEVVK